MPSESVKDQLTEQVISVQSSNDHYVAQACGFICADDKLWEACNEFKKWFEKNRGERIEMVKVFGGPKAFAGGPSGARDFLIDQLKSSIELHEIKRAILIFQINCGAYGTSKAFGNDEDREYRHHVLDYNAAVEFIKKELPDILVEGWIVDSAGFRRIK